MRKRWAEGHMQGGRCHGGGGFRPLCAFPSVNQVFSQSVNIAYLHPLLESILYVLEGFISRCPVILEVPARPEHAGHGCGSAAVQVDAVLEDSLPELRFTHLFMPLVWTDALQFGWVFLLIFRERLTDPTFKNDAFLVPGW